jgi:ectoine hydroxylase-related dioxygenase (phytanoyl-CoA dioxygenase family)
MLSGDWRNREAVDAGIRRLIAPRVDALFTGYRIAFCTFAVKDPRSEVSEVPLHQDWSFVDEQRFTSIGLWCPLIDVNVENGCLQMVKGSHAFGHPPRAACTPFAYPELVPYLRATSLMPIPMKAGQAMLFDQRLFHASPPNRSLVERVAATAVLVPNESTLRYYHVVDRHKPTCIEVFEVDDQFYLRHVAGHRPEQGISLGVVDLRQFSRDDAGRPSTG